MPEAKFKEHNPVPSTISEHNRHSDTRTRFLHKRQHHLVSIPAFFSYFLTKMSYRNVIVTGANRGIGLEFIRQLLGNNPAPKNVIATTRNTSEELNKLKSSHANLHVLTYESTAYDKLENFAQQVKQIVAEDGIDLLINNAGMYIRDNLETVNPKDLLTNIEVNAVAPLALTKQLLPLLKMSASGDRKTIVVNITSQMGSVDDNKSGGSYAYRASKSALNMLSKSLAVDLAPSKIIILSLHPGWVQTDMGTTNAPITTLTSVTGMLDVIRKSDLSQSGAFINYAGKTLPW